MSGLAVHLSGRDPVERGGSRGRRALTGGFSSIAARAANLVAGLVTLPKVIDSLGEDAVGVHLTIMTFISLFAFIDLGIGHGLVSTIAEAVSGARYRDIRRTVTTAVVASIGISAVVAAIASFLMVSHDWSVVLGAGEAVEPRSVNVSLWIVVVVTLANVPASLASSVRLGLQESTSSNWWLMAAGPMQIIAVYIVASSHPTLPWFALAATVPLFACNVGNSLALYAGSRLWLRPSWGLVSAAALRTLLRRGSLFVVLAIAGALAFQMDALVISRVLGPAAVTAYAVPFRLFALLPMLTALMAYPLWPAYAEARSSGDSAWVEHVFRRSIAGALLLNGMGGAALALSIEPVVDLWVGDGLVSPTMLLVAALFGYAVVQGISAPVAMYLNGANIVAFQVIAAGTMAVTNVPLSIFLAQRVGVAGPVLATVATQTICILLPFAFFIRARGVTPRLRVDPMDVRELDPRPIA